MRIHFERFRGAIVGFTLIEVLTAVSISAALAAITGLALKPSGNADAGLRSAQAIVASLISSARVEAATRQQPTRLLICSAAPPTGDASQFLRCLQIVRQESATSWVRVGDRVCLPRGAFVVPPIVDAAYLEPGNVWPVGENAPASSFCGVVNGSDAAGLGEAVFLEFAVDAHLAAAACKIVVASGTMRDAAPPLLRNPAGARGVLVRANGAIANTDATTGF